MARIPVSPFLAVTASMRDAKVVQFVRASPATRQNMLDCRSFAGERIEAHWAATDQAMANPQRLALNECGIGCGTTIHEAGVCHRLLRARPTVPRGHRRRLADNVGQIAGDGGFLRSLRRRPCVSPQR